MIKEEYKYSALTEKVIGCAMRVHSKLGSGFQEVIYQRALALEMAAQKIHFSREHEMPVYYGEQQIGTRRADFLVKGVVSVELKAISNWMTFTWRKQSTIWRRTIWRLGY